MARAQSNQSGQGSRQRQESDHLAGYSTAHGSAKHGLSVSRSADDQESLWLWHFLKCFLDFRQPQSVSASVFAARDQKLRPYNPLGGLIASTSAKQDQTRYLSRPCQSDGIGRRPSAHTRTDHRNSLGTISAQIPYGGQHVEVERRSERISLPGARRTAESPKVDRERHEPGFYEAARLRIPALFAVLPAVDKNNRVWALPVNNPADRSTVFSPKDNGLRLIDSFRCQGESPDRQAKCRCSDQQDSRCHGWPTGITQCRGSSSVQISSRQYWVCFREATGRWVTVSFWPGMRHRMERQAEHAPPICASALGEIHSFGTALARAQLPNAHFTAVRQARK
jgi:hypothetical protein